jgi:hypothetical protein
MAVVANRLVQKNEITTNFEAKGRIRDNAIILPTSFKTLAKSPKLR